MWFRSMLIAFFLNGLSPFGLRILAGWGFGEQYTPIYLVYWYLGGLAFVGLWAWGKKISRMDLVVGSLIGLASAFGQLCLGLALAYGSPGNVVFPIAHSSIFIVATAGVLVFKERLGSYGKAGIGLGLVAAILLGVVD